MTKKILTVSELADHLSVHRITIYRLLKVGSIPGFKIGRVWRFELDQISAWMTTGTLPMEMMAGDGAFQNGVVPKPAKPRPRKEARGKPRGN